MPRDEYGMGADPMQPIAPPSVRRHLRKHWRDVAWAIPYALIVAGLWCWIWTVLA